MAERIDVTSTLNAYSLENLAQLAVCEVPAASRVDLGAVVAFFRDGSEPVELPRHGAAFDSGVFDG